MIERYGWTPTLAAAFAPHAALGLYPARVVAHHRGLWRLMTDQGDIAGRLSGKFAFEAAEGEYPVIGDWLAAGPSPDSTDAVIHTLLPRTSRFTRKMVSGGGFQVVAANIDVAFLVAAMNGDLNARRLERYLVAARDSGAAPVVVLTKADLSPDPQGQRADMLAVAGDAPVVMLSAKTGVGLSALSPWLTEGTTAALLGSSGAGKSTLLNALAGRDLMATNAVREGDDRGRHTTTHRELFRLPGGGLLIDTPGMRELGLVAEDEALDESFADVTDLLPHCRFTDCRHEKEPGCAIRAAIGDGSLSDDRWRAYLKLQKELEFVVRKDDPAAATAGRMRWKQIHKAQKAKAKHRRRNEEG